MNACTSGRRSPPRRRGPRLPSPLNRLARDVRVVFPVLQKLGEQLLNLNEFATTSKMRPSSAFIQIGIFLEIGGSLPCMHDGDDHDVVFSQYVIQVVRCCNEASHFVGWCDYDTNARMLAEESRRLLDLLGEGNSDPAPELSEISPLSFDVPCRFLREAHLHQAAASRLRRSSSANSSSASTIRPASASSRPRRMLNISAPSAIR